MAHGFTKSQPLDTDPTLSANSDYIAASQAAVKSYVDNNMSAIDIHSATTVTIADADEIPIADASDGYSFKKIIASTLEAFILTVTNLKNYVLNRLTEVTVIGNGHLFIVTSLLSDEQKSISFGSIKTLLSAIYAPIANGVTNGDSHDHSGGDGAQINHTTLSNIGTNTHAQIDSHIANVSNPHSVTAVQAGAIPADGWILVSSAWTRTGNHTFTVSGDVTATYRKGTKVRYKDGGAFEYGVIKSSTYSAPSTTVTLISNDDYAMAATTITDTAISYIENPDGFPHIFNWTPTGTGYSSVNNSSGRWSVYGKNLWVSFVFNVVSNATTFTITNCPVVNSWSENLTAALGVTVDGGTTQIRPGRLVINSGSSTITLRSDSASGAWTNTGGKSGGCNFVMEF